ncbi:MAG: hypothetical protein ACHQ5A_06775 [Opitutales bacterium]
MKNITSRHPLVLGLVALALLILPARAVETTPAPDAPATAPTDKEQAKAARKAEHERKMLEKYDANHNGKLDPEEKAQMEADRKAEHDKRVLAKYDANHNGTLDPEEKAQMEADRKAAKEKRQAAKAAKAAETKDQDEPEQK